MPKLNIPIQKANQHI